MDQQAVNAAADLTATRFSSFSDATRGVLEMLEQQLPGSAVFVGHLDSSGEEFRIIDSRGDASFDLQPGTSLDLNESFCIRMATGQGPNMTGDAAADPVYGTLEARDRLDIGSYAGVPLELGSGHAIGSLCAIAHDLDAYTESDLQLLRVLANMLSYQLERDRAQRDLELLTSQLRKQATTDPLTGLLNRRSFDEGLEREFALTKRDGIPSHLLVLDLDGFKQVNDQHGHDAGDRLLVAFADALRALTRSTDLVGRRGGDEFAVVLVRALEAFSPDQWRARVERGLVGAAPDGAPLRTSIGFASLGEADSADGAIAAADAAMYEDKRRRASAR